MRKPCDIGEAEKLKNPQKASKWLGGMKLTLPEANMI